MNATLLSLWNGFPVFLVHSLVSLAILVIGVVIYMRITRHDEMALIRDGNTAAALSLGGAVVGLSLPIGFSLAASVSLLDLAYWGVVTLLMQLIAFRLVELLLKDISRRIESGDMAAATFLVSIKLATAIINSAAISG
jgi:putative membrane protein